MAKRMKRLLLALLLLLSVPLAATAIDMPLDDIHGNKVNLSSYKGKWLVVNYWATWCPPAMVIGINAEYIGKQQLQSFLEDYFITYPVFMSGPTQQSELGLIPGLPTTFLVNPEGEVVARQVGPVTREMIEQFIENWQPQQALAQ
jgi:thiol-disulfide isomerase/thioredoxin